MKFKDMPLVIQASFALTLFNSWVLFEETVVDRGVLGRILPGYRIGLPCVWDVAAVLAIAIVVMTLRAAR